MRILTMFAAIAAVTAGLAVGTADATPLGAAALPSAVDARAAESTLLSPVRHRGRPYYGRPYYGRPYYRPYGYRRYGYRPIYGPRAVYGPRVVCRTRVRVIPTAWGYVRQPERVCVRRW